MPQYESRPGGVLFPKDAARKTNPNQPDFDGELILDPAHMAALMELWKVGQPIKLELAGWKKTSKAGNPFMSLSAKLPRDHPSRQAPQPKPTSPVPGRSGGSWFDDDDEEIPF